MDASKIKLVSFSSAMHSVIALDEKGKPITRCITWADSRASSWAKKSKKNTMAWKYTAEQERQFTL